MPKSPVTDDYTATTHGVRIGVSSFYLEDQSRPSEDKFVWAYRIRITNTGTTTVQLLRRTWHITDAAGRRQRVHGDGVIGQQPILEPGETFEYTSGTPLDTPSGIMSGQFHMIATGAGEPFDVTVPTFSLDSPHQPSIRN